MVKESCSFEQAVLEDLEKGELDREMKRHIVECPVCRDIVRVSGWMTDFKNLSMSYSMENRVLPDPGMIWERAHSSRRVDKMLVKKALMPLLIFRVLVFAAAIAAVAMLFLPKIGGLQTFLNFKVGSGQIFNFVATAVSSLIGGLYMMRLPLLLMGGLFLIYFLITRFDPENA